MEGSTGVCLGCGGPGLYQGSLRRLRVFPSDLLPILPHQESIVPRSELSRPADRCDRVSYYETGHRLVRPDGLSRVREGHTSLIDRQTGDLPPRDLGRGPLK